MCDVNKMSCFTDILRYVSLKVWTYENILDILETVILLSLGGSVQERNIPELLTHSQLKLVIHMISHWKAVLD